MFPGAHYCYQEEINLWMKNFRTALLCFLNSSCGSVVGSCRIYRWNIMDFENIKLKVGSCPKMLLWINFFYFVHYFLNIYLWYLEVYTSTSKVCPISNFALIPKSSLLLLCNLWPVSGTQTGVVSKIMFLLDYRTQTAVCKHMM